MLLAVGSPVKGDKNSIYILDEIIGQGGFGYVFKAHRECDDAVFAVKTMLPSFNDHTAEVAFKNEVQSAGFITGNNIIDYEFIHNGDAFPELPPYIIMEYADGGTLTQLMEQKRKTNELFEIATLLDFFKQLANGMNEINKTLVHRDIKPDNILLCGNTLKISDFGLSKIAIENTRTMTFKGGGTLRYMSPEAFDFSKNTIQMDIYAMGIVFYELATLQYPYEPIPRTYEESKNIHLYAAIKSIGKANSALPASMVSVINRMLEKPTQKRFTNWDDVIHQLSEQRVPVSPLDNIISAAISTKNAEDMARQHRISEANKKAKDTEDFCKLVNSQFVNTIITPICDFAEQFNNGYAGNDKYSLPNIKDTDLAHHEISCKFRTPFGKTISIEWEAILRENHKHKVSNFLFDGVRDEYYIPSLDNRQILLWGRISNDDECGVNLILLKGEELYGDWSFVINTNSGLVREPRLPEPFAFRLDELPKEINYVKTMHIYNSKIEPFCNELLLQWINELSQSH